MFVAFLITIRRMRKSADFVAGGFVRRISANCHQLTGTVVGAANRWNNLGCGCGLHKRDRGQRSRRQRRRRPKPCLLQETPPGGRNGLR